MTTAPRPPKRASNQKQRPPTPPPEITDNRTCRTFQRLELLGQGGFAQCYKIKDEKNVYAIKVVHKPSLKSSKQRSKLLSEIKIHQGISHPNIVTFFSCFEDPENVYMILELCENKTLVDMLKTRKRLTDYETRFYMSQLFDGVRYMHRKGIIHRDIKLGNLFLDKDMYLKIGDFGLAAEVEDGQRKKTICGTPNYIAPEILFDSNGHSFEVDVWSLGVVMYTLLIGKPPFQTKEIKSIYKNIKNNVYAFPPEISISEEAKKCIGALLNSNPEERPTVDDILHHDFFKLEKPKWIPVVALERIPSKAEMGLQDIDKSPLNVRPLWNDTNSDKKDPAQIIESVLNRQNEPVRVPPQTDALPWRSMKSTERFVDENVPPGSSPVRAKNTVSQAYSPRISGNSPKINSSYSSPKVFQAIGVEKPSPELIRSPLSSRTNQLKSSSRHSSPELKKHYAISQPESPSLEPKKIISQVSTAKREQMDEEPKKKLSHLETLYLNLKQGLTKEPTLEARFAGLKTDRDYKDPDVFITKWIDYTNKYGLSYQFRDGSIGVYFNDGTSIILSSDDKYLGVNVVILNTFIMKKVIKPDCIVENIPLPIHLLT